jgi:hypothetical protein
MNLKEMSTVKQAGGKGETEKGVLQECWDSAERWLTSSSATMISDQTGQRALQECYRVRWIDKAVSSEKKIRLTSRRPTKILPVLTFQVFYKDRTPFLRKRGLPKWLCSQPGGESRV